MKRGDLKKKKLPNTSGVYFFIGKSEEILYIGKATSLKSRVGSYFSLDINSVRGPAITKMIEEARRVDFRKTDSVLEALILEASLIKTHKPTYNAKEKDDKSYNYVVITKEAYPRVLIVRGRDLDRKFPSGLLSSVFGPFPHGGLLKEALRIVRKIFPFRDVCTPAGSGSRSNKKCFNCQLGLCPGVCTGDVLRAEYVRTVNNIRLLFEGKKNTLLKNLGKEMKMYAGKLEFEKANQKKKQLFALKHINDIQLLKRDIKDLARGSREVRMEAYDIAHLGGGKMVGAMAVIENGEPNKSEYRKFRINTVTCSNDVKALEEVLRRRFHHDEWRLPNIVVMDGGKAQINVALRILGEFGYSIPVVSVVKDEKHRPSRILGHRGSVSKNEDSILLANSEAHRFTIRYHRNYRGKEYGGK